MASSSEIVDVGHAGGVEEIASEWKGIRAVFHNFALLPSERGKFVSSPLLECHGLKWRVDLYPCGVLNASTGRDVKISVLLHCASCDSSGEIVKARHRTKIPSANRVRADTSARFFGPERGCTEGTGLIRSAWGVNTIARRKEVIKPHQPFLTDGNLVVEVDIQVLMDKIPGCTWTPSNTLSVDMMTLLNSANPDSPDSILFDVSSGGGAARTIYAHRSILSVRSPILASMAEDCESGTSLTIAGVHPNVFSALLIHIYTGEFPYKNFLRSNALAIIRAADRFGCTGLKLTAEIELATGGITAENAAELILFADATNCAMFKEAGIDYFVGNSEDVMASTGYAKLTESPTVMAELMAAMTSGKRKRAGGDARTDVGNYKQMRVASLRKKLDEKGLDVDGSKEILIARLEAADRGSTAVHGNDQKPAATTPEQTV